jgi:D-alanyl-D-alanine carboxypeptidase
MRRILSIGAFVAGLSAGAAGSAIAGPSILFDPATGHVIESDNPFARWYPASLTKLMTTYVAFRMVQSGEVTLASPVRISKNSAKEPPSKMGYKPGSVLTLDNALKILMVKSANDVATAVGESLAGSEAGFALRMNEEARRLGMTGSHFVNAHGLHDDSQYTTPRDLAILSAALRREFPQHAGYFSIEGLSVGNKAIASHNTLIGRFEGADGMKTGYTCPSGFNLVASATRNGRTLMAVVVGATSVASRAEEAAAMLSRGFSQKVEGLPALDTLKPVGTGIEKATNMRDELCSKEGREARRKAEQEAAKAKQEAAKAKQEAADTTLEAKGDEDEEAVEKSAYLTEFDRPRKLVAVELGGATGPVPMGLALAIANEESLGIPLPTWRPDQPPPAGAEPIAMRGDSIVGG